MSESQNQIRDQATPVTVRHLLCMKCRYNLNSLSAEGRCPECGTPVQESLTAGLEFSDPEWLAEVVRGMRILAWLPMWWAGTFLAASPFIDAPLYGRMSMIVPMLCSVLPGIVACIGVYQIGAREPNYLRPAGGTRKGNGVRIFSARLACLAVLAAHGVLAISPFAFMEVDAPWRIFTIAIAAALFLLLPLLLSLAVRLGDRPLQWWVRISCTMPLILALFYNIYWHSRWMNQFSGMLVAGAYIIVGPPAILLLCAWHRMIEKLTAELALARAHRMLEISERALASAMISPHAQDGARQT